MKMTYPTLFTELKDGKYLIEVPDLEILTEGKDLYDAIEMAEDAIGLNCITLEDEKAELPAPSKYSAIDVSKGTFSSEGKTFVSLVNIDTSEYRRRINNKSVRRSVTLPGWLDYEAEHAGFNVSKILQEALAEKLGCSEKI